MAPAAWLLLGVVGVGVALSSRPDPAEQQRKERARMLRRTADRQLLRRWIAIARDPLRPFSMRGTAWRLAAGFKRLWIDSGLSGSRMPSSVSLRIYGNWCGPGYGGGLCVDAIDRACRAHDLAYDHAEAVENGLA